jgi:hypothetical protein
MGTIAIDGYAELKNVSIALCSPYCPPWAASPRDEDMKRKRRRSR